MDVADSLTRHEWAGLMNRHNLADGHARQAQTAKMSHLLTRLPELYELSESTPQLAVQRRFEEAFYRRAGQPSVAARKVAPLHHYSSSLSIEIVANYLREQGLQVGLLDPTFDNIPAILRRHGVPLRPVGEDIFADPADPSFYAGHDAIFLITPNNPTGIDPSPDVLRTIAKQCRDRDLLLIVDFSFRFFSEHLATWDQYAFFESIGVRYIGIEDTGKTWPTLDLKIGSLVADARPHARLQEITDDLLLNVSPFIFTLISEYVDADKESSSRHVARANRAHLERLMEGGPVTVTPAEGPMSVAWLRLPGGWQAGELCDWLIGQGISVLPGSPFHWSDGSRGEGHVRIALMRPEPVFEEGAKALAAAFDQYQRLQEGVAVQPADVGAVVLRAAAELLDRPDATLADDFFALGGDSMSAMHLVGRVAQETGVPQRVRTLFEGPVLGDFAARVAEACERHTGGDAEEITDPLALLRRSFGAQQAAGQEA
ncbi:aminotransferase class I/II-fold pyridoxal phosphate-dependent enzyme [Nonomuraea sp. NPDC049758]|uniref:pyridoxal phosphate-dependent aminotransferase n=1 Tax=Nonomuraea sp. NPDC049758 TaxID=3154360 RepID=UPI00341C299E